jgi:hypothetical protein
LSTPPAANAPEKTPVEAKQAGSPEPSEPHEAAVVEKSEAPPQKPAEAPAEDRRPVAALVVPAKELGALPQGVAQPTGENAKESEQPKPPAEAAKKAEPKPPIVASAKPVKLPKVPIVLLAVSGDEAIAPFVRANLESLMLESELQVSMISEIPVLSEKMQLGKVPLSRYEIQRLIPKGKAHILVLAQVQRAGSMPLKYHGYTQELISATFSIQTVDLDTGLSATAPATGTVKYTVLNLEENFQKEIGEKAGDMGARIREYWDRKLRATKTD